MWSKSSLFSALLIAWSSVLLIESKARTFNCTTDGIFEESHCSRVFWYCFGNVPARSMCPENMVFDSDEKTCDKKEYVAGCGGTRRRISMPIPDEEDPFSENEEEDCDEDDLEFNDVPLNFDYEIATRPTFLGPINPIEPRKPISEPDDKTQKVEGTQFLGPLFAAQTTTIGPQTLPPTTTTISTTTTFLTTTTTLAPTTTTQSYYQKYAQKVFTTKKAQQQHPLVVVVLPPKHILHPEMGLVSTSTQIMATEKKVDSDELVYAGSGSAIFEGGKNDNKLTYSVPEKKPPSMPSNSQKSHPKADSMEVGESDELIFGAPLEKPSSPRPHNIVSEPTRSSVIFVPEPLRTSVTAQPMTMQTKPPALPISVIENRQGSPSVEQAQQPFSFNYSNIVYLGPINGTKEADQPALFSQPADSSPPVENRRPIHLAPGPVIFPPVTLPTTTTPPSTTIQVLVTPVEENPPQPEGLEWRPLPTKVVNLGESAEEGLKQVHKTEAMETTTTTVQTTTSSIATIPTTTSTTTTGSTTTVTTPATTITTTVTAASDDVPMTSTKQPAVKHSFLNPFEFEKTISGLLDLEPGVDVIKSVACPKSLENVFCLNGGQCLAEIINGNEFHTFCVCAPNFHGERCEREINKTTTEFDEPLTSDEDLIPYFEKKGLTTSPNVSQPSSSTSSFPVPIVTQKPIPSLSQNSNFVQSQLAQNLSAPLPASHSHKIWTITETQQWPQPQNQVPAHPRIPAPSPPVVQAQPAFNNFAQPGSVPSPGRPYFNPTGQQNPPSLPIHTNFQAVHNQIPVEFWPRPLPQQSSPGFQSQILDQNLASVQSWPQPPVQNQQNGVFASGNTPGNPQNQNGPWLGFFPSQQSSTWNWPTPGTWASNQQNFAPNSQPQVTGSPFGSQTQNLAQNTPLNQPTGPSTAGNQWYPQKLTQTQGQPQFSGQPGVQNQIGSRQLSQNSGQQPLPPAPFSSYPAWESEFRSQNSGFTSASPAQNLPTQPSPLTQSFEAQKPTQSNQPLPSASPPAQQALPLQNQQFWTQQILENVHDLAKNHDFPHPQGPDGRGDHYLYHASGVPIEVGKKFEPVFLVTTTRKPKKTTTRASRVYKVEDPFEGQISKIPSAVVTPFEDKLGAEPVNKDIFNVPPNQQYSEIEDPWYIPSPEDELELKGVLEVRTQVRPYDPNSDYTPTTQVNIKETPRIVKNEKHQPTPKPYSINYKKPVPKKPAAKIPDDFDGRNPEPMPVVPNFVTEFGKGYVAHNAFDGLLPEEFLPPKPDLSKASVGDEFELKGVLEVGQRPIIDRFDGYRLRYKVEPPFISARAPNNLDEDTYNARLSPRDNEPNIPSEFNGRGKIVQLEDIFGGTPVYTHELGSKYKLDDEKNDNDYHQLPKYIPTEAPDYETPPKYEPDQSKYAEAQEQPSGSLDIFGGHDIVVKEKSHKKDDYRRENEQGDEKDEEEKGHISANLPDDFLRNIDNKNGQAEVEEKDNTQKHVDGGKQQTGVKMSTEGDNKPYEDDTDDENDEETIAIDQKSTTTTKRTTTTESETSSSSLVTTTSSSSSITVETENDDDSDEYGEDMRQADDSHAQDNPSTTTTSSKTTKTTTTDNENSDENEDVAEMDDEDEDEEMTYSTTTAASTMGTSTKEKSVLSTSTTTMRNEKGNDDYDQENGVRKSDYDILTTSTTSDYKIDGDNRTTTPNKPTSPTTSTDDDDFDPNDFEPDLKSASLEEREKYDGLSDEPNESRKKRQVSSNTIKSRKVKKCRPKEPKVVQDPRCIYDEPTPVALGFCRVDFLLCMPKGDGCRSFCLTNHLFDQSTRKCVPGGQCGGDGSPQQPLAPMARQDQAQPVVTPATLAATTTTLKVDVENFCVGKKNGLYMQPRNCSKIWRCTDEKVFDHPSCAPDMAFNEKRGLCDFMHTVPGCSLDEPTGLGPIEGKSLIQDPKLNRNFTIPSNARSCEHTTHGTHFAHENDCSLYYQCVWGKMELMTCPPGTLFNPGVSVCDYAWAVPGCKTNKNPTNSSENSTTTPTTSVSS